VLARQQWLDQNRANAQAVVDAILHGWTLAFSDEAMAVEVCSAVRPDMPRAEHAAQLRDIKAVSIAAATLTDGLGYPDPRHVHACFEALHTLGCPIPEVDADMLIDLSFWQRAPQEWRRTRWQ
jgi:hypothetical protein